MKHEYEEGPKAKEKFETGMKTLFQVPKKAVPSKKEPPKKRAKKSSESDVSRDSGGEV